MMMRKICFVFLLAFLSFAPVVVIQAQGPTPTPDENNSFGQLRETDVVTMPAGFDFTPVTIITPTVTQTLVITLGIAEINTIGQMVTSTFALIDQYNILPYFLVLLLALFVLRWLYKFVTGMPARGSALEASRAIDDYYDLQEARFQQNYTDEELDDLLDQSKSRRRRARSIIGYLRR